MKIIPPPTQEEFSRVMREKIHLSPPTWGKLDIIIREHKKYSNGTTRRITDKEYYEDYYKVYLELLDL